MADSQKELENQRQKLIPGYVFAIAAISILVGAVLVALGIAIDGEADQVESNLVIGGIFLMALPLIGLMFWQRGLTLKLLGQEVTIGAEEREQAATAAVETVAPELPAHERERIAQDVARELPPTVPAINLMSNNRTGVELEDVRRLLSDQAEVIARAKSQDVT